MRRAMLARVVLPAVLCAMTPTAQADKVSTKGNSPTQVQGRCGNSPGGTYFPPTKLGVYGCMNGDGSGIVCGGTGKDKQTCDTWTAAMKVLPTRGEARTRQQEMVRLASGPK